MEEIIPNGTEVIVFFYPSNDSTSTRLESSRTFKGKIISSRESEDLSYHGSAWYEQIYTIEDENGKRYEATYGNAYINNFFIRTIEHHKKMIESTIQSYDEKIAEMNKRKERLSALLEELSNSDEKSKNPVMELKNKQTNK